MYLAISIFFTEYSSLSSEMMSLVIASWIFKIALGISSEIKRTSLPALNASKSINPGDLKFEAPFMFKASVKINPLNCNSFLRMSLTMDLEIEDG